jgi:hypothetical protein
MDNQVVEKVTVTQSPAGEVQTQTITRGGSPVSDFFVTKTNQIIFAIVSVINILLLVRILFLLFGANQVGIVNFIIALTQIFVSPFAGIFQSPSSGSSYLDVASIVAILMYFGLGAVLAMLINLFSSKTE